MVRLPENLKVARVIGRFFALCRVGSTFGSRCDAWTLDTLEINGWRLNAKQFGGLLPTS